MPIYDFRCADCGGFEERRPMAEASGSAACPGCGVTAPRVYASPAVGLRSAGATASAIDERSRNDPQRVRGLPSSGHGHDHAHHARPSRPWQVAH